MMLHFLPLLMVPQLKSAHSCCNLPPFAGGEDKSSLQLWKNYRGCHWLAGEEPKAEERGGDDDQISPPARPTGSQRWLGTKKSWCRQATWVMLGWKDLLAHTNPPGFIFLLPLYSHQRSTGLRCSHEDLPVHTAQRKIYPLSSVLPIFF